MTTESFVLNPQGRTPCCAGTCGDLPTKNGSLFCGQLSILVVLEFEVNEELQIGGDIMESRFQEG